MNVDFRLIVRLLAVAVLTLMHPLPTAAESAHPCDDLAAHPRDPNRMAKGIAMGDIVPRPAIAACQEAVSQNPSDPRFHYQLGRAYEAAGQLGEAIKEYKLAADLKYPAAYFNLGFHEAENGNIEEAKRLYQLAGEGGMQPAYESLAQLTFDSSQFSSPALFDAIYEGTLSGASDGLITYMTGFMGMFYNTEGCRGVAVNAGAYARISQLGQAAVFRSMFRAMADTSMGGYEAGQNLTSNLAVNVGNAESDVQKFYDIYGCRGPVADVFFRNLQGWVGTL